MATKELETIKTMARYIHRQNAKEPEEIRVAILEFLYLNAMRVKRYKDSWNNGIPQESNLQADQREV